MSMSDEEREQAVLRYANSLELWRQYTTELKGLLTKLLESASLSVHAITGREKDVAKFREKISRPGKSYSDPLTQITDLCGVRIITHYPSDVGRVASVIRSEFEVDEDNSIDKSATLGVSRVGYMSVHFVVKPSASRVAHTEWKPYQGMAAEIQVRTILQHAWAEVEHSLNYKPEDGDNPMPRQLLRRLNRLSGILETADEVFESIRIEKGALIDDVRTSIEKGELEIPIDETTLLSLHKVRSVSNIIALLRREGAPLRVTFDTSDDDAQMKMLDTVRLLHDAGARTLADIDRIMTGREHHFVISGDYRNFSYSSLLVLLAAYIKLIAVPEIRQRESG